MKMRLTMALGLMAIASMALTSKASMAGDTSGYTGGGQGCHPLMTARECAEHTRTLARLAPGGERDNYLLDHDRLIRDREIACSCSRNVSGETRHRIHKQAALRF